MPFFRICRDKDCLHNNNDHTEPGCMKCGSCLTDDNHCHTKEDVCIPLIEDCQEHYLKCGKWGCAFGCHDECSCKDPGY